MLSRLGAPFNWRNIASVYLWTIGARPWGLGWKWHGTHANWWHSQVHSESYMFGHCSKVTMALSTFSNTTYMIFFVWIMYTTLHTWTPSAYILHASIAVYSFLMHTISCIHFIQTSEHFLFTRDILMNCCACNHAYSMHLRVRDAHTCASSQYWARSKNTTLGPPQQQQHWEEKPLREHRVPLASKRMASLPGRVSSYYCVSSYYLIHVVILLMLLHMCPHTTARSPKSPRLTEADLFCQVVSS